MCLVFNAREQTKDVNAIFHPEVRFYDLAKKVAQEQSLPPDWLNESTKGYVNEKIEQVEVFKYLQLTSVQDIISNLTSIYDPKLIQPKTQYRMEEISEILKSV